jgi:hypothetical protein
MDHEPRSDFISSVDFGGFLLTHCIWRNSYGSYQPETGVRTHASDLKDFQLVMHGCDDWPLVTVVVLAGMSKGWHPYRIEDVIMWLHHRKRRAATRRKFAEMHNSFVRALSA